MNLADILARDLEDWPEGVKAIEQSSRSFTIFEAGKYSLQSKGYSVGELADDREKAIVTRAQWQAAVDALKAGEQVWDGETLPPIGQKVKIGDHGGNQTIARFTGKEATIIAHNTTKDGTPTAVFKAFDTEGMPIYHALVAGNGNFEKVRAAEQMADKKRKAGIEAMIEDVKKIRGNGFYSIAEDLYDAGYRKQVQP